MEGEEAGCDAICSLAFGRWWFEGDSEGRGDDLKEARVVLVAGDDMICLRCLELAVDGAVVDKRRRRGRQRRGKERREARKGIRLNARPTGAPTWLICTDPRLDPRHTLQGLSSGSPQRIEEMTHFAII